jgi:hypothetical protein
MDDIVGFPIITGPHYLACSAREFAFRKTAKLESWLLGIATCKIARCAVYLWPGMSDDDRLPSHRYCTRVHILLSPGTGLWH